VFGGEGFEFFQVAGVAGCQRTGPLVQGSDVYYTHRQADRQTDRQTHTHTHTHTHIQYTHTHTHTHTGDDGFEFFEVEGCEHTGPLVEGSSVDVAAQKRRKTGVRQCVANVFPMCC
jgi:ABC-type Zn2+ transport system substrate-binding protein/surface adhesin